ncbi:MAG TPA: NAD(P)H-binding protein [Bacteroidales bacterium]|nr:NAD(P)H-binding protein [Bacteroidales bacterium]
MKIAVTGASGHLGHAIVRELLQHTEKENVVGIARTTEKAKDLGVEIRKGDYNNREEFLNASQGIDVLVFISSNDAPENRTEQHSNVIKAAVDAGVKKIVYASFYGDNCGCSFQGIIDSNRITEKAIQESGLQWVFGRNGLYIDPDFDAVEEYKKEGKIRNSAGDAKCAYTSRAELAVAFANMALDDSLVGGFYNLCAPAVSQTELTSVINSVFDADLVYEPMSVEEFDVDRKKAHGEFYGGIISGIYQGVSNGAFDVPSDFERAAGRPHKTVEEMAKSYKQQH